MIRSLFILPLLAVLLAIGCTSEASVESDGDLVVEFTQPAKENIAYDYHLQADGSATYFCLTANVGTVTIAADDANASSQDGTFTAADNSVSGTLSQPAPPPNGSWVTNCAFPLTVQVQWTNITLTNVDTGRVVDVADASTGP